MTTLLAFAFVLGVLVFVHELGHFMMARWHGVRVLTFSLGIGAAVMAVVAWFAVLFTGRWPERMRDFLVRFANYYYRVWVYVAMVTPAPYPRFGL